MEYFFNDLVCEINKNLSMYMDDHGSVFLDKQNYQ